MVLSATSPEKSVPGSIRVIFVSVSLFFGTSHQRRAWKFHILLPQSWRDQQKDDGEPMIL
jgi:hypothetical protein